VIVATRASVSELFPAGADGPIRRSGVVIRGVVGITTPGVVALAIALGAERLPAPSTDRTVYL
jgi:hypothetical protein